MAKKNKSSAFAVVQQIGKSFFLPVSVLPIAGILLGLGSSFTNADTIAAYHLQGIMGEGTILNALLTIMSQVGNTIFVFHGVRHWDLRSRLPCPTFLRKNDF